MMMSLQLGTVLLMFCPMALAFTAAPPRSHRRPIRIPPPIGVAWAERPPLHASRAPNRAKQTSDLDQESTPLVDALAEAAKNVRSPLFYPGHKMGRGAPSRFVDIILGGKLDALRHDLPELPELDNLFAPEGPIREAEELAADAFGAEKTWLLANGSTCGVLACIIACVQWHNSRSRPFHESGADSHAKNGGGNSGSVVILPRDAHKSAVHALVLSGATPCFLPPARHAGSGISLGIEAAALEAALREHGDKVAAVFLVTPTYEGACTDVAMAAQTCHAAGAPLVVDEAHGAHLAFLDIEDGQVDSPRAALACGADLVVQSAHKTLGSLTQSALLHLGKAGILTSGSGSLSARRAVSDALATVQSSSPSYLLLASLDAVRWSLVGTEKSGKHRLQESVRIAREVQEKLATVQGIHVLELGGEGRPTHEFLGTDPLRLTVSFDGGLGGYEADELLIEEFGVYGELPSPGYITFVFGPGSTLEHGEKLMEALRHVALEATSRQLSLAEADGETSTTATTPPTMDLDIPARQICTPREAFFSPHKAVNARDAIGQASAETVCPYPPGIPTLLPGEVITQRALDLLTAVKGGGGVISGCTDPTLETMVVVDTPGFGSL